ncbi:MAG: V-type ATP synthase subunit F [Clostridiales bacterium]|jgi:V/A-type H+-transporting ATPase subunit F|nr:V-type ATP synthase subunit F [Clostridiales bacterium]
MNRTGKLAVIGDNDSALAFRAVGAEVFAADSPAEAERTLTELKKGGYAVVFITEDLAAGMEAVLRELKTAAYPVVIPIPGIAGSNGYGLKNVKKDVEKAVGVDIVFNTDAHKAGEKQ